MDEDTIEVLETLEVVVTPDDIAQGKRDDCYLCPFSLALQRAGYVLPWVGYDRVCPTSVPRGQPDGVMYRPPAFAHTLASAAWVRAFDNGEPVAPGLFILHRWVPATRSDLVR